MTRPQDAELAGATSYETLFVPALFEPCAARVVEALGFVAPERVLDVACGTGALARRIAPRVMPGGRVIGVDVSPAMLAVARQRAPELEWCEGRAEALPFADAAFDVVVSQCGLMFFADRQRALAEMQRVLTPEGRMAVVVWDELERIPAFALETELLARCAGPAAAQALQKPFELGGTETLTTLFREAGLSPQFDELRFRARFPSARVMVEADLRGWLPLAGVVLPEAVIEAMLADAERTYASFVDADGAFSFDITARLVRALPERRASRGATEGAALRA